jgi:hypothetical protein
MSFLTAKKSIRPERVRGIRERRGIREIGKDLEKRRARIEAVKRLPIRMKKLKNL